MNKSWADYFEQSFLGHVYLGHFPWELIRDFPSQEPRDREKGDRLCEEVVQFIDTNLDEDRLRSAGRLPEDYLEALRKSPYSKMVCSPEIGGGGFTHLNAFRAFQTAFHRSLPAAFAMSVSNAFGVAALIPTLPECDFKRYVVDMVRAGALSGWADTEPAGAANWFPSTRAVSGDGGKTFVLNGEKCYIGNGTVADVLIVSATVDHEAGGPEAVLFAVDTRTPGFRVRRMHDFMGIEGAPMGALSFKDVVVGRHQLLEMPEGHWRDTLLLEPVSALGRMFTVVAAASSISKRCLKHILQFQQERIHDGRPIRMYRKIQALTAKTAAEIFALDSVIEWCLLGSDGPLLPNRWWEQTATKNIVSLAATRIADRAISMLGAAGYEKAESKRLLGLPDCPTEREYRDARAFRISGGVDFLVDLLAAQRWMTAFFYNERFDHRARRNALQARQVPLDSLPGVSAQCLQHLRTLQTMTAELGEVVQTLVAKFTIQELVEMQPVMILLNRIANEIFTIAVTIARARARAEDLGAWVSELAEEYAAEGMLKLEMLRGKLRNEMSLAENGNRRRETIVDAVSAHLQFLGAE